MKRKIASMLFAVLFVSALVCQSLPVFAAEGDSLQPVYQIYEVHSVQEFLNAIGSNRTIRIMPDEYGYNVEPYVIMSSWQGDLEPPYNLSPINNSHVRGEWKTIEGKEGVSGVFVNGINIRDVQNLSIVGAGEQQAHIFNNDFTKTVLMFTNCSDIKLYNLKIGHGNTSSCSGDVLLFDNCSNINIDKTYLYGSGATGLVLSNVQHLIFSNSKVDTCTYAAMGLYRSNNINFINDVISDNLAWNVLITILDCSNVNYCGCTIENNRGDDYSYYNKSWYHTTKSRFLSIANSSDLYMINSVIRNNNYMEVGNKSGMSFISTKLSDNSFDICNDEISYTTNKIAYDSKSALNILKSVRKLDAGDEFYEQQIEKTGFVWDDGSYYMFGIDFKDADSDISCRYMIKKNTADVYVMDINKDSSGNTLKRYQPDN